MLRFVSDLIFKLMIKYYNKKGEAIDIVNRRRGD